MRVRHIVFCVLTLLLFARTSAFAQTTSFGNQGPRAGTYMTALEFASASVVGGPTTAAKASLHLDGDRAGTIWFKERQGPVSAGQSLVYRYSASRSQLIVKIAGTKYSGTITATESGFLWLGVEWLLLPPKAGAAEPGYLVEEPSSETPASEPQALAPSSAVEAPIVATPPTPPTTPIVATPPATLSPSTPSAVEGTMEPSGQHAPAAATHFNPALVPGYWTSTRVTADGRPASSMSLQLNADGEAQLTQNNAFGQVVGRRALTWSLHENRLFVGDTKSPLNLIDDVKVAQHWMYWLGSFWTRTGPVPPPPTP